MNAACSGSTSAPPAGRGQSAAVTRFAGVAGDFDSSSKGAIDVSERTGGENHPDDQMAPILKP